MDETVITEFDCTYAITKDNNLCFCSLKVTASQMNPPGESLTQLILTETENDRVKWVTALQHLHRILKKNKEIAKPVSCFNGKVIVSTERISILEGDFLFELQAKNSLMVSKFGSVARMGTSICEWEKGFYKNHRFFLLISSCFLQVNLLYSNCFLFFFRMFEISNLSVFLSLFATSCFMYSKCTKQRKSSSPMYRSSKHFVRRS